MGSLNFPGMPFPMHWENRPLSYQIGSSFVLKKIIPDQTAWFLWLQMIYLKIAIQLR